MADPITADERAEWRALDAAAHPGPWFVIRNHVRVRGVGAHPGEKEASIFDDRLVSERDARFIAAARTAFPRTLDALDTAEAEVVRLRAEVTRLHALVATERAARPAPVWDEDLVRAALVSASLPHEVITMSDGHPSVCVRTPEEAADAALTVIRERLSLERTDLIESRVAAHDTHTIRRALVSTSNTADEGVPATH